MLKVFQYIKLNSNKNEDNRQIDLPEREWK